MNQTTASAARHAMLFAYLARQTIDTFGKAGEDAVSSGVIQYGLQRGRRMALRTLADGRPLTAENYLLYGEWKAMPTEMDLRFPAYSPEIQMETHLCPWYTEWSSRGLLQYGAYYCRHVDTALARGYHHLNLELLRNRTLGDDCCSFVFRGSSIPADHMEDFANAKQQLGDRAKLPWDYHIGHLFHTMRQAITAALGEAGQKAVQRALEDYRLEYGDAAVQSVLEYADLNYDELPPYPPESSGRTDNFQGDQQ